MHLLDTDIQATEEEFRVYALNWLNRHVGFDGVVWGKGKHDAHGGIAIEQYLLQGRPQSLITDYLKIAYADPVSRRFINSPQLPQNVSPHIFYCEPEHKNVLDYLERYRIRHLFLKGRQQPGSTTLDWIVLYRDNIHRPFEESLDAIISSAISLTLSAVQFQRSAKASLQMPHVLAMRQERVDKLTTVHLTERQHQVLDCLMHGWSNKMISKNLTISENTLKTHLASMYRAMNVTSRTQAIIFAKRWSYYS
jgi:DNA-binding CsgD family transcriptional regulator